MLQLPQPRISTFFRESSPIRPTAAMLADQVVRLERGAALRARIYEGLPRALPARWLRPEPRASVQYAGHMATTAARDHRLTPQSKALLQVLRARCGTGTATATCKTTLAHIMGVCTRSVGRYIRELIRFGYVVTRERRGARGLTIGLAVSITEKVLPCFRNLPWLAGWLAQNMPENGGFRGRTELSYTNHSHKEFPSDLCLQPERTP